MKVIDKLLITDIDENFWIIIFEITLQANHTYIMHMSQCFPKKMQPKRN